MTIINISTRMRFVEPDGTLTPSAYRALFEILDRTGGALGESGTDTFCGTDAGVMDAQPVAMGDTFALADLDAVGEVTMQPGNPLPLDDMVMQPASELLTVDLPRHTTASAPAYRPGRLYFDTTLNKARIGGATAYETITSS